MGVCSLNEVPETVVTEAAKKIKVMSLNQWDGKPATIEHPDGIFVEVRDPSRYLHSLLGTIETTVQYTISVYLDDHRYSRYGTVVKCGELPSLTERAYHAMNDVVEMSKNIYGHDMVKSIDWGLVSQYNNIVMRMYIGITKKQKQQDKE